MPYVQRDGNGYIIGLYPNLQPGYAEEFLSDTDQEVLDYQEFGSIPTRWANYLDSARARLVSSDITINRCYEDRILVPEDWRAYRNALREIVSATVIGDFTAPLPTQPPFPVFDPDVPNLTAVENLSVITQDAAPTEGGTIQIMESARDVMLAIAAGGYLNEITIKLPPESIVRANQRVQFGTLHAIGKINWLPHDSDTGVTIMEAPSMLNAEESGALQRSEPGIWFLAD